MAMRLLILILLALAAGCGTRVSIEASSGRAALAHRQARGGCGPFQAWGRVAAGLRDRYSPAAAEHLELPWGAYYGTGLFSEAKRTLPRALQLDSGDFLARLYLGIISLRESAPQSAVKSDNSFGLNEILFALKKKVSPRRLAALVKERGVNFDLSAEPEKELRRAGADDELVGQVRASSRLRANTAPLPPAVREIERALKEIQSWQLGVRKTELGRSWDSPQTNKFASGDGAINDFYSTDRHRPEFISALEPLGRVIDEEVDLTRIK